MSKKKEKNILPTFQNENIIERNIAEFCKEIILLFGANINLARSVPDVHDGLKPSARRVLYTLYILSLLPDKPHKKSARIVGEVLGKFHPHGDSSVYDVLVRLGQYWQVYPMLVNKHGNFGSIDGDQPAAMRYTEAKMTQFAYDCYFKDWEDETIDMKSNFDNTELEPEYFDATYPVILFHGSYGLGYGLYTGIPPYNVNEVCDLIIDLIKNPKKKKVSLIPDFPTPMEIVNMDFETMNEKGEGTITLRGKIDIEDGNLIIKSIPYQTKTSKILDQIEKLVLDKKITGLIDYEDDSYTDKNDPEEKSNIRIILKVKKGASPEKIREDLYKSTLLKNTFSVNMELVDDYENVHYNLKAIALDFIELAMEKKTRLHIFKYKKLEKKYHMNLAIVKVISKPENDAKISKIFRNSETKEEAYKKIMEKFDITSLQAEVIGGFNSSKYTKQSLEKYRQETEKLKKELDEIMDILDNPDNIAKLVIEDMKTCKKKYGRPRQCEVVDIEPKDYVPDTEHLIVITKRGYMKKMIYSKISDHNIGNLEQGDKVLHTIRINNRDSLLIFDNAGKCFKLNVSEILDTPTNSVGLDISNYINTDNKIISVMQMPTEKESEDTFLFVTQSGIVKKSQVANYTSINNNKAGLISVVLKKLKDGSMDKVVDVIYLGRRNKDILIYTLDGKAVRFNTKEIPTTLRTSSGVIGIKMKDDDKVTGTIIIDKDKKYLAMITSTGNAKKYEIADFTKMTRASEGVNLITLDDKEKIVGVKSVNEDEDIDVFYNTRVETINTKDIFKGTRKARGKKLLKTPRGEHIVSL